MWLLFAAVDVLESLVLGRGNDSDVVSLSQLVHHEFTEHGIAERPMANGKAATPAVDADAPALGIAVAEEAIPPSMVDDLAAADNCLTKNHRVKHHRRVRNDVVAESVRSIDEWVVPADEPGPRRGRRHGNARGGVLRDRRSSLSPPTTTGLGFDPAPAGFSEH